jgi:hypothetical protein
VPLGYSVIDHKLVIHTSESTVVKEVFSLSEARPSLFDVIRELRARGRTRRKGPWTKDSLLRVLRNPLYAGLIAAGGELCAAEHEPIIERAQFERVQGMLGRARGASLAAPGRNVAYLLRGLLRCGSCGAAMTPGGSHGYRYYRCVTRDKQGKDACRARPLAADAIERFVVERLRATAADPSHAQQLAARMRARFAADAKALSVERAALPTSIARLAAEANGLLATLERLSGRARRLAEGRLEAAAAALEKAQGELDAVDQKLAVLEYADADVSWVLEALSDFAGLWDLMTPDNRQRLVSALVERIEVSEEDHQIQIRLARLSEAA